MQELCNEQKITNQHFHRLLLVLLLFPASAIYGQTYGIKNGVNIQASYYNRGNVNLGWDLMEDYPEIEALRIEIEPYRAAQARTWIKEAQNNNYQVIATYHDSDQLGSNKKEDLVAAAKWWKNNYKILSSTAPFIINIMNEWGGHSMTPKEYATAYNEVIPIIREVYDGPLIVDVPGFGQATEIAADAYALFNDKKIIFSVHIYTSAFNVEENRWLNESDLSYLAATGAGCMIGEFCDGSRGGANWCSLVDYAYQNDWPIFGWAWNGDGGTMNMIEPHWRNQPLATSFRPTALMDRIINKLAGVPCFTLADKNCTGDLINTPCNDNNVYTINDRYNEYCHCTGNFTSFLQTTTTLSTLHLYPNPVGPNNQLLVEFIKINQRGQVSIFNSLGKNVDSFTKEVNEQNIVINTNNLDNGLYWVLFQSDGEEPITKAFIK